MESRRQKITNIASNYIENNTKMIIFNIDKRIKKENTERIAGLDFYVYKISETCYGVSTITGN